MPYEVLATSQAPALIVYLLDVSASMSKPLGTSRRLNVVCDALMSAIQQMVFRSTKGTRVTPRYRIAMFAYSDEVYDLLDGILTIDRVAPMGVPPLKPMRTTRTAKAFGVAERLLKSELHNLRGGPAPLVCHLTDGEYNGEDPEPVAKRIMEMTVDDGPVLVENIFISDDVLPDPISDAHQWTGITSATTLATDYANKLRAMSSAIPETYLREMNSSKYRLAPGSVMLIPGSSPELVSLGFQMSAATPTTRR